MQSESIMCFLGEGEGKGFSNPTPQPPPKYFFGTYLKLDRQVAALVRSIWFVFVRDKMESQGGGGGRRKKRTGRETSVSCYSRVHIREDELSFFSSSYNFLKKAKPPKKKTPP